MQSPERAPAPEPALDLPALYEQMILVRVLEEELQKLCDIGEAGDLHLNRGQEAIALGVCAAIRPTDYVVGHHRTIAHAVAKGVPLYPLVAELLGKADGICGGMSGEMHLSYPAVRFMFSFQLVGTCVRPDCLVLGDNKPIAALSVGDLALGRTGFNRISQVFSRSYDGEMVKIVGCGMVPVETTPDHLCWTVTSSSKSVRNPTGSWTHATVYSDGMWKAAGELRATDRYRRGDFLGIPRLPGVFDDQSVSMLEFVQEHYHEQAEYDLALDLRRRGVIYREIQAEILQRFGRRVSFNLLEGWTKGKWRPRRRLAEMPLTRDTAWMLGLYVAEGCFDKRSAVFTLNSAEEATLGKRVLEIADTLGVKGRAWPKKGAHAINLKLYSKSLGRALMKWCGSGAAHKQIPEVILLHKDLSILEAFLDGYMAGDGHLDRKMGRATLCTVSRLLAAQLQLAYARLGTFAQVSIQPAKHPRATAYRVRFPTRPTRSTFAHITDDYIYTPVRKITRQHYVGTVHNIETDDHTYLASNALVHNCVPIAAGLAWAARYVEKTDDIVVVFHGDAATSNAAWHEGMGLAAIRKVPLLLICENNHLAGNIRPEFYMPTATVMERAAGYGVAACQVDGTHAAEVFGAVRRAAEFVRQESRPFLVECDVPRFSWHKQGQRDIRGPEEMAVLYRRDPVPHTAALLGYGPEKQAAVLEAATATVREVVARARAAAPPAAPRAV